MGKVITVGDQISLVETASMPDYMNFKYPQFNPVQSRTAEFCREDVNCIVASKTGSGKTLCAEQFIASEVRERGGKAVYIGPLKALAKEKIDDWTDPEHQFSDLKIAICTGDYRITPDRIRELDAADIIVMTSEMLSSRCRNASSENSTFLKSVGTLVVDESHLLTVPGRGDHLEMALVKLAEIAPNARIVFLSATMPNVSDIAEWLAGPLNGKDTYLLNSTFRPCPLAIHYEEYDDFARTYEGKEQAKVNAAMNLIQDYSDDIFIAFVHTKRTGQMLLSELKNAGISCEFHSADLSKEQREIVGKKFKNRELRVLVATSTVAWGCNLPARRVVILGVHRGMQEVETYDIVQMCGRAGRPGLDPRGDAYVLLPQRSWDEQYFRITTQATITSRLLDAEGDDNDPHYKNLAFHLVADIHRGLVTNREGVRDWFERTLAKHQSRTIRRSIIDATLDLLIDRKVVNEEDGFLTVTPVGVVASLFYFSPFDASDLRRNFSDVVRNNRMTDDIAVSVALGNIDSQRFGFLSRAEKDETEGFRELVRRRLGRDQPDGVIKAAYCYYQLMSGNNLTALAPYSRVLQFDFERTTAVLEALGSSYRWGAAEFFKELASRVASGMRRELIPLAKLEGIGRARAEKLYAAGFRIPADILAKPDQAARVLNMGDSGMKKVIDSASTFALLG